MHRIQYICDKCFITIGSQIMIKGELQVIYLYPIGNQEWCYNCLNEFFPNFLALPEKIKLMTPKEIEQNAKV